MQKALLQILAPVKPYQENPLVQEEPECESLTEATQSQMPERDEKNFWERKQQALLEAEGKEKQRCLIHFNRTLT